MVCMHATSVEVLNKLRKMRWPNAAFARRTMIGLRQLVRLRSNGNYTFKLMDNYTFKLMGDYTFNLNAEGVNPVWFLKYRVKND